MSNNDNAEACVYQGNDGEEVPRTVQNLTIHHGVRDLPDQLCDSKPRLRQVALSNGLERIGVESFVDCHQLVEINEIPRTVKTIGDRAFAGCGRLKNFEFEDDTRFPHQLATIGERAFYGCNSISRIKPPSSLTTVESDAFSLCSALVEADLSKTRITKISDFAFAYCRSLQTVSLPDTLSHIVQCSFYKCRELVTVVVPLHSQPIMIEFRSFGECHRLANMMLPEGSTSHNASFVNCKLLRQRYGENGSHIVDGLIRRFEGFSVHEKCYDHRTTTPEELRKSIADQMNRDDLLVDNFGMTPFHVLLSTGEPSMKLLQILLEHYSYRILDMRDANDERPLDYLFNNWTDGAASLVRKIIQKWMIDPLALWGAWEKDMKAKVGALLVEDDKEQLATLFDQVCSSFEKCEKVESKSVLELVLWKVKLNSGRSNDGSKRQALDREQCRCTCGSDVVIPNVASFLWPPL